MPRINIFNSHRWNQDDEENKKLKDWLHNDDYYNFNFYEISKGDVPYETRIKEHIRNCIDLSNVFIAFNNQTSSYDKDSLHSYEIDYAMKKNKPIVLIKKWGTYQIPIVYQNYNNIEIVNWNKESLRNAIKKMK
ncbi:hypothetical protein HEPPS_02870 [Candidatus Hepatoplasma crinochetorum]|uniref:Thoeris protein ThsB TIR-like domain-containing protein n=1 Tax=Candidatus Hepatoplasma crinochetorum TaxID=295596 RepID=A0A0G7ZLQ4_9MOLU|nr:hypothetical protein HEPPS_02870 [Candidatus Hepatoplasma crinochetorum]